MRFSRLTWGVLAAVTGLAAMVILQVTETRLLGRTQPHSLLAALLGVGVGVIWLADRLGLVASAFVEPPLRMHEYPDDGSNRTDAPTIDALLKATDLDDLLRIRRAISSLTSDEVSLVRSVIGDWTDRQGVANLLFNPDLIPDDLRIQALDRALRSPIEYFVLAAIIGLQGIALDQVPLVTRTSWLQALETAVQSTSAVLANRASVTLFGWVQRDAIPDILPALLLHYPVADEGACRNIVAAVLAKAGDLSGDAFGQQLVDWGLSGSLTTVFRSAHDEYQELRTRDPFRATLMKGPAFAYIPNLSDSPKDGRAAGA